MNLALDSTETSHCLVEVLGREGFVRASLLEPPQGVAPDDFALWSSEQRDRYWITQAEGLGADLLLECDLRYEPRASGRRNEKFWLNLPLFLLGGPMCYFVNDRSYSAAARLSGDVHELNALVGGRASLQDRGAEVLHLTAEFAGTSLDMIDRAGGSPGPYALSLLVPAGLLAREGERVERALEHALVAEVSSDVALELVRNRAKLVESEPIAGFHLDPELELVREGSELVVRGRALLTRPESERLEEFTVRVGREMMHGDFGAREPDPEFSTSRQRVFRYPLEARLPWDKSATTVRIELLGGGRDLAVRSYTFALPEVARD